MNPNYLSYCIKQAIKRPGVYVPTRLEYLAICMENGNGRS